VPRRFHFPCPPSLVRQLAALAVLAGCASSSGSSGGAATATRPDAGLTFDQALVADSSTYEPTVAFRAVAETDWAEAALTGTLAGPRVENSRWRLGDDCTVHFTDDVDVLATSEGAPLPTRKLGAEQCRNHTGFWQISAGRVFWWMPLAGGWSAEYYGDFLDDSTMLIRRYSLRRTGDRAWRADRDAAVSGRASRLIEVRAVKATYAVTTNLRAVGEPDWATRPGSGSAPSVAGTRWRMPDGCVLTFGADVLARGTASQRLTRALSSAECDGLKGSWQQVGKRIFWLVNLDSLTAVETYADVADTVMHARHFDLNRPAAAVPFTGTWNPTRSHSLTRVRR
jgi:hypothetical protein